MVEEFADQTQADTMAAGIHIVPIAKLPHFVKRKVCDVCVRVCMYVHVCLHAYASMRVHACMRVYLCANASTHAQASTETLSLLLGGYQPKTYTPEQRWRPNVNAGLHCILQLLFKRLNSRRCMYDAEVGWPSVNLLSMQACSHALPANTHTVECF